MSLPHQEKLEVKDTISSECETPQLSQMQNNVPSSYSILNFANVATLPMILIFNMVKNVLSFLQGNLFARIVPPALVPASTMRIAILTEEQEEIMQTTPIVQKSLQANMSKAKHDQEMIEVDIDDLKERLARIEARMNKRNEMK